MSRGFDDVEFGAELPELEPDTGVENVTRFAKAAGMFTGRFTDHEAEHCLKSRRWERYALRGTPLKLPSA